MWRVWVEKKLENKVTHARLGSRWENSVRIVLKAILWEDVEWIYLTQDMEKRQAVVNTVMKHPFS